MNAKKQLTRVLVGGLSAACLMAMSTVPAQAQDELILVAPTRATMYLNGGIGKGEQQYMEKVAKEWPLRMIFSERKDNDFVADVALLVTGADGTPMLQLSGAGPMTDVMLPPGKYRVTASRKGQTETREVTLDGKTGRDVWFHWKGTAQ